jgi:hypothetical protein
MKGLLKRECASVTAVLRSSDRYDFTCEHVRRGADRRTYVSPVITLRSLEQNKNASGRLSHLLLGLGRIASP